MLRFGLLLFFISGIFVISRPVRILSRWNLPEVLREISGIAYLDKNHFACIQDELGTIYIYNTGEQKIEREIVFTGVGDFEGISLVGESAWVLRSDGHLFEIDNINKKDPAIKEYALPVSLKQNMEGLCYDRQNNRLLLAIKESNKSRVGGKMVYGFDLESRTFSAEPVINIDTNAPVFRNGGKKEGDFLPSDIAIHPLTHEIYITEGRARLLIMDPTGKIKELIMLEGKEFSQPEGISFDTEGNLYISNEGHKDPANILEISIGS